MRSLRASSHASHIPDVPLVAPRPLCRPPKIMAEQVGGSEREEGRRNVKEEFFSFLNGTSATPGALRQ